VEDILNPPWDADQRERQHDDDKITLWFSVDKEELMFEFEHTDRFEQLVSQHRTEHSQQSPFYPRLVTFVGHTGAGKSTLVRMLIERPWLAQHSQGQVQNSRPAAVPVVGLDGNAEPTSGDVHLYRDPQPPQNDVGCPLFYADAEGFFAGETPPKGSKAGRKISAAQRFTGNELGQRGADNDPSFTEASTHALLKSWSLINTWKLDLHFPESMQLSKRGSAVKELFPRLLYNFSDVVVYVVRSSFSGSMEDIMVQLLNWSEKSSATSINLTTLPHVIIAINDTPLSGRGAIWDPERATMDVFSKPAITRNLQGLLRNYSSVKVLRIPSCEDRLRLSSQVQRLYEMIDQASRKAQTKKREGGMLLSSKHQKLFFHLAFKHYTQNMERPFDFITQLLKLRPVSCTLGGNVLLFLRDLWMACCNLPPGAVHSATNFMEKASPVLSSTIALIESRHSNSLPGRLRNIFEGATGARIQDSNADGKNSYRYQFEQAINLLCDTCLPCEAFGGRCANFRLGHAQGHKAVDGERLGGGDFESTFVQELESKWDLVLSSSLDRTERSIDVFATSSAHITGNSATWAVHCQNLKRLYAGFPHLQTRGKFTCFWCLQESPSQVLPCGHAICILCAKSTGSFEDYEDQRVLFLERCILHHRAKDFPKMQIFQLKPAMTGNRILSLDGGGVRGIIELRFLEEIESKFNNEIRIQRFFDLIAGTSTGALIALGLGIKDWSVQDCKSKYLDLCIKAFQPRKKWTVGKWIAIIAKGSMYRTKPLIAKLLEEFEDEVICGAHVSLIPFRAGFDSWGQ
jgi:hypothetical protein